MTTSRNSVPAQPDTGGDNDAVRRLLSSLITSPVTGNLRAVFANRTMRFDRIQAVGFDLDHTLVVYDNATLDSIAMRMVIDRLIAEEGYSPSDFNDIPEPSFARKGLAIDVELGNVLKVDRHGHVLRAYNGVNRLRTADRRRAYGSIDVIPHVTQARRFLQSDTAFAHPELLIWAALAPRTGPGECRKLWERIRHHTDAIHRDGSLKAIITADVPEFIRPDPETVKTLRKLREGGKKLFLLTNSEWEYTRRIVPPAFGLDESDDSAWLDLFDLVIVESRKPRYFKPDHADPAEPIQVGSHTVLRGGHIGDIEDRLGVQGPEILYVGDHIYGDLISSKRATHWRTMLVIPELEDELRVQQVLPGAAQQMIESDVRRSSSERMVQHWLGIGEVLGNLLPDHERDPLFQRLRQECLDNLEQAQHALKSHIQQREDLNRRIGEATNSYWGSLFRADNELTYYGKQLEDFADIYSARATNLGLCKDTQYFRSAIDFLPHEAGPA